MDINTNKVMLIIFSFVSLSLFFFPLLAYLLSFIILILIVNSKDKQWRMFFFLFFIILILSNIVNEVSIQKFLFREDDFTTYYNNYLELMHGNYDALFEFGGGLEVGLPLVNYFMSAIINQPTPYLIQVLYISIIMMLVIYFISISLPYATYNKLMLLLWVLLFIKLTAMLTIERQAIASFFVLFAIFEPRKRLLWLMIGCLFHLTTPIVYCITKYIVNVRTYKKSMISGVILFALSFFSYYLLSAINSLITTDKIGYVLYFMNDDTLVRNEIIKSVKQIIYVLPLCIIDPILRFRGIRWEYGPSIFLFCISMLILSALPGVPTRALMPIVFILYGYYYYSFFSLFPKKTQVVCFSVLAIFFSIYKLILPGYYHRFPVFYMFPGYYIEGLFEEVGYVDRFSLPSSIDAKINNGNKF